MVSYDARMLRIELDEPTLARTRIAISPLWESLCSLFLLNKPHIPWPYDGWAARAREVLDTVPATAPVQEIFRLGRRFPDFLSPVPRSATPAIEEELAALRDTPREVIEEQLAGYQGDDGEPGAGSVLTAYRDPGRLARLADGLQAYWDAAIAPHWPAMRSALEEEVLLRARSLAALGPEALLGDLHERIRWERPTLSVVKLPEASYGAADGRLMLIPLIFSKGALLCSTDNPGLIVISYQSRGAVVLADRKPEQDADDKLSILLGRGRAAVLKALVTPATTAAVAAELGLAPSTVSEHLSGLLAAGVVHRRRAGRKVLYGHEPAGAALVNLLGEPMSRTA